MKVKIVYFAYLIPDKWENIIKEQLDSLKKLKLYNDAINIYMSIISDDEELVKLKILLKNNYDKVQIYNLYNDNYYEYPGIQTIYKIAEDDDDTLLLYFHSKGITSNQHETRQYLFKYTIENYNQYIYEFNKNKYLDVAGAIPHLNGFVYFNFFWARSSYIRNYCSKPEISENRYIWEVWVGSEFSRKKEIVTYSPIIKYDQVKNNDEVWDIHNRMIKNEYYNLLEPCKIINKPQKIINGIVNNKPIKIIKNNIEKSFDKTVNKTDEILVNKTDEILVNKSDEMLVNKSDEILFDKPINKPQKIINGIINNKPIKIIKNNIKNSFDKTNEILVDKTDEILINKSDKILINKSDEILVDKSDEILINKSVNKLDEILVNKILVDKSDEILVDKSDEILINKSVNKLDEILVNKILVDKSDEILVDKSDEILFDKPINKPQKIINGIINNKPIKIIKNNIKNSFDKIVNKTDEILVNKTDKIVDKILVNKTDEILVNKSVDKLVNKPQKIINGVINNKPTKIIKNNIEKPFDKIVNKTDKIVDEILVDKTVDNQIDKLVDKSINNSFNKPIKIDINKEYQVPKPIKITNNKLSIFNNKINYINPYTIFEKLKNKNHIVVELSAGVGLNTYMLSKRFKKVIIVENNKENILQLESNIRNYCRKNIKLCKKRLTQIKDNISNCITFKELIYNEIHKYFQNIHLIVCNMDGKEEDILEDIFHYAFHSKVKILIKLNIENWNNKDLSRFNYLFEFYDYDKNLLNLNEWIIFEAKNDKNLQLFKNNMSIVVIGFNQYTYITKMIKQLEPYSNDIIIIDNNSDYKPLIKYYETEYKYSLLKMDKNYGHKVYEEIFIVNMLGNNYIITDPDLEFNKNLPSNFIQELVKISKEYKAGRVGFALLIDADDIRQELSYASMPLKEWEGRFWKNKINHPSLDLYNAPIDTTFCLLNTTNNIHGLSIRIGGNYICKHKPWHHNYYLELLNDEYDYYLKDNKSTNYWFDKSKKKNLINETTFSSFVNEITNGTNETTSEITSEITNEISEITNKITNGTNEITNKITNKITNEIIKEENLDYTRILIDSDEPIENIDEWIINKVTNEKGIAINIGCIDVNNLVDKFKYILNINPNISCINNNVTNYDNKIVAIKENKNDITLKQFIYDNTIYKKEIIQPIKFINISYDGDEENIIEDLLHYCWVVKSNICIHFNFNNWINKNIERFYYLFEFFNIYNNNKLINISELKNIIYKDIKILFIPNTNLSKDLFKKNMSCVIIGFNQPTYIKKMVTQLEKYTSDIIIIDNNSDFTPLINYYDNNYKYTLLKMKSNLGHKVYEKSFMDKIVGDIFIITDPDLEFNKKLPDNFIDNIINISNYFQAEKVGFALEYKGNNIRKDIKAFGKSIEEWEKQYWVASFFYPKHEIWSAAIDTTFCLVNKQNKGSHYRIAGDYLCKHLPWYIGFEKEIPIDEYENYLRNNVSTNYWKKS